MDDITHVEGVLRVCCADETNLIPNRVEGRPDLIVKVCRECGRRHIELHVDPGHLGMLGGQI